jgi:glycosyltransferase involved in cell wall biosynthesis
LTAVVHNCVDVPDLTFSKDQICSIKRRYNIRESDKVITNIGHFSKQKAQDDLLKAFRTVANNRSDVRLVIIGWGTLEVELKRLTKTLKLEDKVIFTGKLLRPQVFEILSITDLFVLSSHWEGLAIVIAEAMAFGKPVISTATCGSDEIVEDQKTGILVPIKNPQTLAEAILDLLGKPDLMVQMGEEGLKRVTELFNCEQFIKGYEAFYESILLRHSKRKSNVF